ncbi:hypothetical protein Emed_006779 [Eimeria media]
MARLNLAISSDIYELHKVNYSQLSVLVAPHSYLVKKHQGKAVVRGRGRGTISSVEQTESDKPEVVGCTAAATRMIVTRAAERKRHSLALSQQQQQQPLTAANIL